MVYVDRIIIRIEAMDNLNRPKLYGEDFFRIKLFSRVPYAAVIADKFVDYRNGTYLASFPLLWEGFMNIEVLLVHPAEAIPLFSPSLDGQRSYAHNYVGEFEMIDDAGVKRAENVDCSERPPKVCLNLYLVTVKQNRDDIVSVEKSQLQGAFVNSVWCELSTNNSKRSRDVITVGVVYRSPNSSDDNDVVLFDSIRKAAKGDVVIMGDFNFPDINWIDGSSSRKGSNFLDVVQDCFLHQHVTFPTRGDNILDLVLSSNPSNVVDLTGLGKLGTSDHDILAFDVVCKVVILLARKNP
ncbi:hypothetical protein BSL78_01290 [Apostichopus japonicus]|uniref:Endonuclease/exonuclease/phosphatase domain-containing protein n=1 Tax=Stichopus japonicus TaxID=307972 RepID=A0A2G8LN95_STIJA|nr:hypothetical protein BSL78_01290 [Apostichopus japonicus]